MLLCMRTTLQINDQLLIRAKKIAAETHRTLTSIIEDALRLSFENQKRLKTSKPFKIRTFDGGGPFPGIDINHSAALLDILDEEEYGSYRREHPDQRPPKKPGTA
jgi:hypothetical protein